MKMKKYLFFLLLMLMSVGASATVIPLTFDKPVDDSNGSTWKSMNVTNAKSQIKVGDFIVVSFKEVTVKGGETNGSQYAICNESGTKIKKISDTQDWYNCAVGDKDFTFTIDQTLYNEIQTDGLQIGYNNLENLSISIRRMNDNWSQYKPTGDNVIEIMSTPQYIKDWYSGNYCLKTSTDYVGKTLRVVCLETADDSYAFLKKGTDGWPSLMSGSDKFSIAGWKYFEIKINDELNQVLRSDAGLLIGGNDYFIAGIYVYGSDTTAPAWTEDDADIVDTYTVPESEWKIDSSNNWGGCSCTRFFL